MGKSSKNKGQCNETHIPLTSAPSSTKRDATSPLDSDAVKKTRTGSIDIEPDPMPVYLSDEQLNKIADTLQSTLHDKLVEQMTDMISTIVKKVTACQDQTINQFREENKLLCDNKSCLEERIDILETNYDEINQYSRNCRAFKNMLMSQWKR